MAPQRQFEPGKPWFREPWPWIIIGLLGTVILASLATLWIAIANPDAMVVDESEYNEIRSELRAQEPPTDADGSARGPDAGEG